eukprot:m.12930 g.12930  ORF g.12930 m.12930 type:complete len:73 (-) comp6094_c0_seq1:20-238(-)
MFNSLLFFASLKCNYFSFSFPLLLSLVVLHMMQAAICPHTHSLLLILMLFWNALSFCLVSVVEICLWFSLQM